MCVYGDSVFTSLPWQFNSRFFFQGACVSRSTTKSLRAHPVASNRFTLRGLLGRNLALN